MEGQEKQLEWQASTACKQSSVPYQGMSRFTTGDWGKGTEEIRRETFINHLESHTEHKEKLSFQESEQRIQKAAAPLLNCGPLHLPVGSRRGLGLCVTKGKNTEKHRLSSVAATWCQSTPVPASP